MTRAAGAKGGASKADVVDLDARVTNLEAADVVIEGDIDDLEAADAMQSGDIGALQVSDAAQDDDIGDLQGDIAGLQSDLATVQTDVADAQADATQALADAAAAQGDATDALADAAAAQDDADLALSLTADLAAADVNHDASIAALESDVAAIAPVVAYEIDWSAQANQLGIASGNVVVDGKTWTAANAADATLFEVRNGEGLKITSNTGSKTWTGGTTTSPALHIPFESLSAEAAKYEKAIEVWCHFSAWATPASSNAIIVGSYAPAGAVYTAVVSAAGFTNNGSASFPMLQRTATFTAATALSSSYDVVVWRFLPGGISDAFVGNWSSGWPTALTPIGDDVQPAASTIVTAAESRRSGALLVITPATRAISGSPSFTLAHMRVVIG